MNIDQPTDVAFNAELNCLLINLTICSRAISRQCYVEVASKFLSSDHCLPFFQVNLASDASPSKPGVLNRGSMKPLGVPKGTPRGSLGWSQSQL